MTKFHSFFEAQVANALETPKGKQLTGYSSIDNLGGFRHGLNVIAVENTDEIEMFLLNSPCLVKFYPYLEQMLVGKSCQYLGETMLINCIGADFRNVENLVRSKDFINIVFVGRNKVNRKIPTVEDIKGTVQWRHSADVVIIPEIYKAGTYHDTTFQINVEKHKNSTLPTQPEILNIQKFYTQIQKQS